MQNQTLPIQLSPTALAPAPARVTTQANSDSAVFSQTLNREMQQRQDAPKPEEAAPQPTAQPQPKPVQTQPAKTATSQAPVQQAAPTEDAPATDDTAAADTTADSATADTTTAATTTTKAADTTDDTATAAAAGAAVAAPMADMLAMLASYKALTQAAPKADAAATAAATDALKSKGGTTIATETQTLATLENALKKGDTATDDDATGGPVRASLHMPAESAAAGTKKADPNDPAAAAATTRTTPDVAATATKAAPQSDAALATLRDAAVAAVSKDTAPVTGSAFQAQLTSAATTQAAVKPSSDVISARLGTTAWDNQVSQKVVWMVGGADQTASLTLNPPDLGPVQVVLNVNNDQATVAFSSATPEVREALENAMPRLREMLSDAGVTLSQSSVNANMPDGRQADTSQNQGNGNRGGGSGSGRIVRSGETEIALPASVSRVIRDNSNVDTFA